MVSSVPQSSYTYDEVGKLVSLYDGFTGKRTTYYYDAEDRIERQEIKAPDNSVYITQYYYDSFNRLVGTSAFTTASSLPETHYEYDIRNLLYLAQKGKASQTSGYNSLGLPYAVATMHEGGTIKLDTYTYVTKEGKTTNQLSSHQTNYGTTQQRDQYTYDARGNVIAIAHTVGSSTYNISYED